MPLHPGIKVGPNDWLNRFTQSGAQRCEIWYNVLESSRYREVFEYIEAKHIQAGLHFWGTVDNVFEPNIAYPGKNLEKTIQLIKQSIDAAAQHKCRYVNVHCGNTTLIKIDLYEQQFLPDQSCPEISLTEAEDIQRQSIAALNTYAQAKGVIFLVETIPARTPLTGFTNHPDARLKTTSYHSLPVATVINRAKNDGLLVTNDFCHTFADDYNKPLETLWQALWDKTIALAPYTKLLHINTVVPPYNGTDSHHGITDSDFEIPGIFPTREKLIELLKLFNHRHDVWAINEPSSHHVENFLALKNLLSQF